MSGERESRAIRTERAPRPVGHYSQAIAAGGLIWVSGQVALDPLTGELVAGGAAEQARQALANVAAVLEAAGSGLDRVVRTTVYLIDLDDFEEVNRVYAGFFPGTPPARVSVEVRRLPRDARVEIDAVALS